MLISKGIISGDGLQIRLQIKKRPEANSVKYSKICLKGIVSLMGPLSGDANLHYKSPLLILKMLNFIFTVSYYLGKRGSDDHNYVKSLYHFNMIHSLILGSVTCYS